MKAFRRTKIVCTIGPATQDSATLERLIDAGMDVARLNFSHGTHEGHAKVIARVRRLAEKAARPIAILQDICGPKIRLGEISPDPLCLSSGETVRITSESSVGTSARLPISCDSLARDVKPGETILLRDGTVRLQATSVEHGEVVCDVEVGGEIRSHCGVNLPDTALSVPSLTPKDRDDLAFGVDHGVDWVAQSFVRRPEDVLEAREVVESAGGDIPILAKIEKGEALAELEAILAVADGAMVARGDLGVETDLAEVPLAQKRIIRLCNRDGKPVITATQMLESMVDRPMPTRAEVNDVANAIMDGTDAVMLSQETAIGRYPLEAVAMMAEVAEKTERALDYAKLLAEEEVVEQVPEDAISYATCHSAMQIGAAAIIASTTSGTTARHISRYRPPCPIIAPSDRSTTVRRLALSWGVLPIKIGPMTDTDDMFAKAAEAAKKTGLVAEGDLVVVTAGLPVGQPGSTNMLKIDRL